MNPLIERYIDLLIQDPNAPPPQGMDVETAAFVRALVSAGTVKTPEALRRRIWQRSLDAARTANTAHSQTLTFPPTSNGHQVRITDTEGENPMAQMTFPARQWAQTASSPQRMGILTLAAAIALVIFGVFLLTSIPTGSPSLNTPEGDDPAGSLLHGATETPTAVPTSTPLPSTSGEAAIVDYVIQPGDTLLSILQQFNIADFAAIRQIMALNNFDDIDQLPSPGTMIHIPVPTLTAVHIPSNLDATALPPTVVPPAEEVTVTATPVPFAGELVPAPQQVTTYVIHEGDTLLSIVMQFDTTVQTLAALNPQLEFLGCNFARLSGGADCRVVPMLMVGDEISVPFYLEAADSDTQILPTLEAGVIPITATPPEVAPELSTATPFPTLVPR